MRKSMSHPGAEMGPTTSNEWVLLSCKNSTELDSRDRFLRWSRGGMSRHSLED